MKIFIALLALVSGLLIYGPGPKADETAKWCVGNLAEAHKLIEDVKSQGFPTRELDEANTAVFLSTVTQHGFIENIPSLPNAKMTILVNPGVMIWGIIYKGDNWCARVTLGWADYEAVMKAMRPKNI
jgi:hypothetical protein